MTVNAFAARSGSGGGAILLPLMLALAAPAAAQIVEGEAPGGPDAGGPGARPEAPAPDTDRRLTREETPAERRARERDMSVFDDQGRIRDQRDQNERQPDVTIDRLKRDQQPNYSVGPGVDIIRRQP